MDRSKKLLKNTIILMFGTVMTKGLNFIMAPLFTRWLPPEDYGTFDLLCTYVTLLIPILAFGTHHAVFRFLLDAKSNKDKERIVTNTILLNVVGAIIYFLFLVIICLIKPSLSKYAVGLSVLLLSQTLQNYMGMYIRGIKRLKLYTISNILCTFFILVFVTLFVKNLSIGLNGMIYGYCAGYLISMAFGAIACKIYNQINIKAIDFGEIKKILYYSIPMIPNSIAWWIVNISDRMIVSFVLGVTSNAILAVSHKIPNLCTTLYDVFQTAWVENASEFINDSDWDNYLSKTLNIMGRFCISVSTIIITTNFFVYDLLFVKAYSEGKFLVPLFALAIVFASLSQTLGSVFVAEYNSKMQGLSMLQAGILNIVIHVLLIGYIGIFASAVSTIMAYLFLLFVRYRAIKKKYNIYFERKTVFLGCLIIIYTVLSYIDIGVINIGCLISSIIISILFNVDTLKIIIKKIKMR